MELRRFAIDAFKPDLLEYCLSNAMHADYSAFISRLESPSPVLDAGDLHSSIRVDGSLHSFNEYPLDVLYYRRSDPRRLSIRIFVVLWVEVK